MVNPGAGDRPAGRAARPDPDRPLRPPAAAPLRGHPTCHDPVRPPFRPCLRRHRPARHPPTDPVRHRPLPRRGRGLAVLRPPDPGSLRYGLRPGEPADPGPGVSRLVPPDRGPPSCSLHPGPAGSGTVPCPGRRRESLGRGAEPGLAVGNRLRARHHRQQARLSVGRGRGPSDPGRQGVAADDQRSAAGPRHPPPGRRARSAILWSCGPIPRSASPGWSTPAGPGRSA